MQLLYIKPQHYVGSDKRKASVWYLSKIVTNYQKNVRFARICVTALERKDETYTERVLNGR